MGWGADQFTLSMALSTAISRKQPEYPPASASSALGGLDVMSGPCDMRRCCGEVAFVDDSHRTAPSEGVADMAASPRTLTEPHPDVLERCHIKGSDRSTHQPDILRHFRKTSSMVASRCCSLMLASPAAAPLLSASLPSSCPPTSFNSDSGASLDASEPQLSRTLLTSRVGVVVAAARPHHSYQNQQAAHAVASHLRHRRFRRRPLSTSSSRSLQPAGATLDRLLVGSSFASNGSLADDDPSEASEPPPPPFPSSRRAISRSLYAFSETSPLQGEQRFLLKPPADCGRSARSSFASTAPASLCTAAFSVPLAPVLPRRGGGGGFRRKAHTIEVVVTEPASSSGAAVPADEEGGGVLVILHPTSAHLDAEALVASDSKLVKDSSELDSDLETMLAALPSILQPILQPEAMKLRGFDVDISPVVTEPTHYEREDQASVVLRRLDTMTIDEGRSVTKWAPKGTELRFDQEASHLEDRIECLRQRAEFLTGEKIHSLGACLNRQAKQASRKTSQLLQNEGEGSPRLPLSSTI